MAPIKDTSRADLLRLLSQSRPEESLPYRIYYKNNPVAELRRESPGFVLYELKLNSRRAAEAFEEAMRQKRSFLPENYWQYYQPGRIILSARTLPSLLSCTRLLPWPPRPGLRNLAARLLSAIRR